jgi:hypothetical protein
VSSLVSLFSLSVTSCGRKLCSRAGCELDITWTPGPGGRPEWITDTVDAWPAML